MLTQSTRGTLLAILGVTALLVAPATAQLTQAQTSSPTIRVMTADDFNHPYCTTHLGSCIIVGAGGNVGSYGVGSGQSFSFVQPSSFVIQGNTYSNCVIKDLNPYVVLSQGSINDLGGIAIERNGSMAFLFTSTPGCGSNMNAIFDDQSGNSANTCPATNNFVMRSSDGTLSSYNNLSSAATWSLDINNNGPSTGSVTDWGFSMDAVCTITPSGGGTCTNSSTQVCLNNSRFKVTMVYQAPNQSPGNGHANVLTSDTGWFWFFNSANVESIIKVINGCGLNNRYWVFAAGLTNVKVTITVTDTAHGTTWTRVNNQGTPFAPIQDTSAFATCP
ncbi:MAG: hypothetical protein ACM3OB_02205 [Acidobacteriota bacterium]